MESREEECVTCLLDPSAVVADKAQMLADYLQYYAAVGASIGVGRRGGRETAIRVLCQTLSPNIEAALDKLRPIFVEIDQYRESEKAARRARTRETSRRLHEVPSGTPVAIKNYNRDELVFFLEAKRTRFVAEYPDGRLVSVPVELFLRVHDEPSPERLSENNKEIRQLIRALASRQRQEVSRRTVPLETI
ncbi:MAG: hypothetical protein HY645_13560 [Acidobacteria bacterium]|nr:hypothetical protein [Acidobacteriota bacterium]